MNEQTLKEKKLDLYVILKIIKYCTGSSARSYQCKYVVNNVFMNIDSIEELGAAIKKVIQYHTIRGKFSSVHPDLAAEGITRLDVGEKGLYFNSDQQQGDHTFETLTCLPQEMKRKMRCCRGRLPCPWRSTQVSF